MNPLQQNITEIAENVASKLGFLLVEVALKGDNRNRIIEIYIDSVNGVTIDECAEMSRQVAEIIESTDLITAKYRLDVSSPGVDRPLKFLEQYQKNINRKFEISLKDESESDSEDGPALNQTGSQKNKSGKTAKIIGKLLNVDGDILTFSVNNTEIKINFNSIKTAKVLISF